jgi:crotonobetainyl-CoA:carnitine CoA-transferase CaiB-like acyl-CoA transferase
VSAPPLSDVKVLDLTRLLPGGFCSLLLADLGAEVLKVEDTGMGDYVRWSPPYYGGDEQQALGTRSALYLALNRGKRSVRLDLKSDAGREAFLRLVASHDIVLDGFRPGVLDRLGVGFERLREANPAVVLGSITGYGQDGPNTQRAGHDINYLSLVGMLGLTGEKDGPPVSAAGQIADVNGGLMAAVGVMAALHEARRSGQGQAVDVSMADGALSWLGMVAAKYLCDGEVPRRGEGILSGGIACYLPYEAADGWISCGALEPKFWAAFCNGAGRPDLIEEQFAAPGSEGHAKIAEVFRSRTREEWRAFNDEHDCCIEPVLDVGEALSSELVRAREMVVEVDQPELGPVRLLGNPIKLSRTPGDPTRPAPAFGEHTEEVLREAGYREEEVAAMLESGAAARSDAAAEQPEFRA